LKKRSKKLLIVLAAACPVWRTYDYGLLQAGSGCWCVAALYRFDHVKLRSADLACGSAGLGAGSAARGGADEPSSVAISCA
jgi:hypothetical protein